MSRLARLYARYQVSRLPRELAVTCHCGGVFEKAPRHGYPFVTCHACGLVTTWRRFTADATLHLYRSGLYRVAMTGKNGVDIAHLLKERRRAASLLDWAYRREVRYTGQVVADIGCGLGGGLIEACRRGATAWGYEIDEDVARVSRALGFNLLGFAPATIVMMSHVLEHLHDPLAFLRIVEGHLETDGVLLIETPELTADTVPSPWHLWYFTQGSLRGLLERARLTVMVMEPGIRAIARRG